MLLARLFAKPSNLLVLDEPTNDLDIETLELLESLLVAYQGTVLLVSHDRAFLNEVVTSTLAIESDGGIGEYDGGYDDYLSQRPEPTAALSKSSTSSEQSADEAGGSEERRNSASKRSVRWKLSGQIENLESEFASCTRQWRSRRFTSEIEVQSRKRSLVWTSWSEGSRQLTSDGRYWTGRLN